MNTPITVSRNAGPATLKTPLAKDDAYSFRTHDESRLEIRDADGWLVATVHGSGQGCTAKAERLRSEIVRACNSHAQFVAIAELAAKREPEMMDKAEMRAVLVNLYEMARAALTAAQS